MISATIIPAFCDKTVENRLKDAESKKLIALMRDRRVKIQFADSFVLDKESEKRMHQGFIAFVSDYKYSSIESIIKLASSKDDSIVIVLDEISDPHNLGSIIRVAECGGVDGIIIPERRSAQVNDNHVKIARVVNLNTAIEKLKDNGFWVTGAELGGEDLYKADLTGKLCLVIGSEGFGIRKLVKENCDRIVTIPMRGKVNSLNASVACGIVLFEALRQRNGK